MIGKYPAKLDEKNRMFVPAKLREDLGEQFFVTLGVNCGHRCLTVYTAGDWKQLTDNYNALPISKRGATASLLFMNAAECCPDRQFRFGLNQFLLNYSGIDNDAVIVGRAGQAGILNSQEFAAFEAENLTPEKLLASLEDIGL